MSMPQKPHKTSRAGVAVSLGLAVASAIAFYAASLQPQPKEAELKTAANTMICPTHEARLGNLGPEVRGSTRFDPWTYFNQTNVFRQNTTKTIDAPEVPRGRALSVQIDRYDPRAYNIGVSMLNQRSIRPGETVVVEVWLRAKSLTGRPHPIDIEAKLQENSPGFSNIKTQNLTLTSEFTRYSLTATVEEYYCPGKLNFALHLATGAQIIEIGPGNMRVDAVRTAP